MSFASKTKGGNAREVRTKERKVARRLQNIMGTIVFGDGSRSCYIFQVRRGRDNASIAIAKGVIIPCMKRGMIMQKN